MRLCWTALAAALLGYVAPLPAQTSIGGVAIDSYSGAPLSCVDVALEDTTRQTLSVTRTDNRGLFQIGTGAGVYRLRFEIWDTPALYSPWDTLAGQTERMREYRLAFDTTTHPATPRPDTAANTGPWPVQATRGPVYPRRLREEGVDGEVLVQFVIDSTGRVDPGNVQRLRASAPEFEESVRMFLRTTRFKPARRNHVPTCALVRMPFVFEVRRY